MRPRFEFQLPVASATWLDALRGVLADESGYRGQVFRNHAVVEVGAEQRSFWSPYLNLEVGDEPEGTAIRGRFSPHPHVWTLFMAIYILLAITAVAGVVYGLVQHALGAPPWGVLITPAAVAVFGFVYGATLIGQGLGAEQMYMMRRLVDRASEGALEVAVGVV